MQVTRISSLTGKQHTREIDVTPAQLAAWMNGQLIQVAMPDLSTDDREFIKLGITPEEWEAAFGDDE